MSVVVCKFHPTLQAVDNCFSCHSAICLNDVRKYNGVIYCTECYATAKSKNRRDIILIILSIPFLFILGIVIGIVVFHL